MKLTGTASTRPYYRRKLFFATFIIVLLGALSIAAGLRALFPSELGTGYGGAIITLRNIDRMLVPRAAGLFAVMTGLIVLAIAFLHLFYSHRIAGPAFRLGREAERIGKGDLKADFQLRKKDNLTDLADALKLTARRYREAVIVIDRHAARLEEQAVKLAEAERPESDPAIAATLRDMAAAVKAAEKMLSVIRT